MMMNMTDTGGIRKVSPSHQSQIRPAARTYTAGKYNELLAIGQREEIVSSLGAAL
jgi:hypothetical protein